MFGFVDVIPGVFRLFETTNMQASHRINLPKTLIPAQPLRFSRKAIIGDVIPIEQK